MTIETCSLESSDFLHQVMHTLIEGVAITDLRGRLIFANRALERLLGYEQGELVGQPWTALVPPRLRRPGEAWPFVKSGEASSRHEVRLLRKDGSTVPAVVSSCRLSDDKRQQGFLSTFLDLRERQHLQAQVEELAAPALMGQHIASIVHELSNSLTILAMQAQLLSKRLTLAPPIEQNLVAIQNEARRMIQMVDNLRATADPNQVHLQSTDVNALIEATLDLQRHSLQAQGIEVTTDLDANLPSTGADPYKLQQVLVNVINNARQAMATIHDARKLNITTRPIPSDGTPPHSIQIRIADTGPGIAADLMARIFKPFFTTKQGDGMGLGLSICDQIIKKHGGRIWAENNADVGVTFILEFPAAVPNARDPASSQNPLPAQSAGAATFCDLSKRHHILVVDDEPAVGTLLGRLLEESGFEVTTTTEAYQALTLLDEREIDLIVSDLKMPRMSGEQFWQVVRERHPRLAERIIFATGDSGSQRSRAFFEDRGCAWIRKPYKVQDLLGLIQKVLHEERVATHPG